VSSGLWKAQLKHAIVARARNNCIGIKLRIIVAVMQLVKTINASILWERVMGDPLVRVFFSVCIMLSIPSGADCCPCFFDELNVLKICAKRITLAKGDVLFAFKSNVFGEVGRIV